MKNRTLDQIADELRVAFRREVADVVEIGRLLEEAQARLDHGEWLPWLQKELSISSRSASRYMKTFRFVQAYLVGRSKSATLADLKLRVSALFLLAEQCLDPKEVEAVLKAAKKEWIGATKAWSVIHELRGDQQPPPQDGESSSEKPPPEPSSKKPLEPHEEATQLDTYLKNEFSTAIKMLMKLRTKPSAKFVGVAATGDLQMLANFLNGIAAAQSKTKPTDKAA